MNISHTEELIENSVIHSVVSRYSIYISTGAGRKADTKGYSYSSNIAVGIAFQVTFLIFFPHRNSECFLARLRITFSVAEMKDRREMAMEEK